MGKAGSAAQSTSRTLSTEEKKELDDYNWHLALKRGGERLDGFLEDWLSSQQDPYNKARWQVYLHWHPEARRPSAAAIAAETPAAAGRHHNGWIGKKIFGSRATRVRGD